MRVYFSAPNLRRRLASRVGDFFFSRRLSLAPRPASIFFFLPSSFSFDSLFGSLGAFLPIPCPALFRALGLAPAARLVAASWRRLRAMACRAGSQARCDSRASSLFILAVVASSLSFLGLAFCFLYWESPREVLTPPSVGVVCAGAEKPKAKLSSDH